MDTNQFAANYAYQYTNPETYASDPYAAFSSVVSKNSNPNLDANGKPTKPAKKQVKKGSGPQRMEFQHHSSEYNIWYHKRLGDRFVKEERVKSSTRCCVNTDMGYTRADLSGKDTWICIYFARGHCAHGADCQFFHRIPYAKDEANLDLTHDVFGRERHSKYREDMGGVGSFSRDNRTLYVGGLKRSGNLEQILTKHFCEWGELEYVRMIHDKSIAFVRYKLRSSAEFAKEAMQCQSLDGDEVLDIRWANEDPNPTSQVKEKTKTLEILDNALQTNRSLTDVQYQYNAQDQYQSYENYGYGEGEQAQQQQVAYDYFPSQQFPNQYPDTSSQYQSSYTDSSLVVRNWLTQAGVEQYTDAFLSAGYFDISTLSQLDDIGLDAVGVIKTDHRKKLLTLAQSTAAQLASQQSAQNSLVAITDYQSDSDSNSDADSGSNLSSKSAAKPQSPSKGQPQSEQQT